MCGIAGFIRLNGGSNSSDFLNWFNSQALKSLKRGPDAFGIIGILGNNETREKYDTRNLSTRKAEHLFYNALHTEEMHDCSAVMVNFRGIPTSEGYGEDAFIPLPDNEIQPFKLGDKPGTGIYVSHNGLLSNDKELFHKGMWPRTQLNRPHDIDSYAFLWAMKYDCMLELEGSWAVAILDKDPTEEKRDWLYLSRTFLSLFVSVVEISNIRYLVWHSEEETTHKLRSSNCSIMTWQIPIHSRMYLDLNRIKNVSPLRIQHYVKSCTLSPYITPTSAAVVLSGGLDSTTVAAIACNLFEEVHLLHFSYGANAGEKEREAVTKISRHLASTYTKTRVTVDFIDLTFLKQLGGSTLIDAPENIATGERGVETASEWVPFRNGLMISMAAAYCDRHKIDAIMLGLNREESAVYSDNSSEFFQKMQDAISIGAKHPIKLIMPLESMMKWHIYRTALKINAPIHLSWSCYRGGDLHCGTCGPCLMRKAAARMNAVEKDSIDYAE